MDDKLDPAREFINRVRASTLRESVTCEVAEREEALDFMKLSLYQGKLIECRSSYRNSE